MHPYVRTLHEYMEALGRSDYGTVKGLFTPGGQVKSPFLGEMSAGPFFDRLAAASAENVITPIDVFLSNSSKNYAYLDIIYDTHPIRASAGNKYEL